MHNNKLRIQLDEEIKNPSFHASHKFSVEFQIIQFGSSQDFPVEIEISFLRTHLPLDFHSRHDWSELEHGTQYPNPSESFDRINELESLFLSISNNLNH